MLAVFELVKGRAAHWRSGTRPRALLLSLALIGGCQFNTTGNNSSTLEPTPPDACGTSEPDGSVDADIDASVDATVDAAPTPTPDPDPARFVDPLIGTGPSNAPNPVGGGRGGSVYPGAVAPFGMVQWSPDTPHGEPSGYIYTDTAITGFSLTHFSGAGCANNGDLPILPTTVATRLSEPFAHTGEHASPGSYDVTFTSGVRSELTATTRTGFGRFRFPTTKGIFIVDPTRNATSGSTVGTIHIRVPGELGGSTSGGNFCASGNRYTLYYVVRFDRPWTTATFTANRGVITFDGTTPATVHMKVAISFVSEANAAANLAAEDPGWDFDLARNTARTAWNQRLSSIQVAGGSTANRTKFYTALYHSFLAPNVASDVNGDYLGFDGVAHKTTRVQYANFSGWDIYRSQIQLLAALFPAEASDMVQSLVNDGQQCGALPKWSHNNAETNVMVGDPGSLIVASAHAFGARNFDTATALTLMEKVGSSPRASCNGKDILPAINEYIGAGFITQFEWGPASTTLEYASRDFAVARYAQAVGATDTQRLLTARAASWRNVLHPNGLIEQRAWPTGWKSPLNGPGDGNNREYVEGNAEQYTWMVPHDPRRLFDLLGGDAIVVPRLDRFFTNLNAGLTNPNFYMGNEPNFATPWMYDWAHAPHRTQDVVRRIIDETFTTAPGGLPGNDDLGATSSWLVWAALGIYPEIPGVAGFAIGSPLFQHTIVHLAERTLVIDGVGAPGRYVQSATLDGAAYTRAWLPWDAVKNGASLRFTLGTAPSSWGSGADDAPPSFGAGTFASIADAQSGDAIGDEAHSVADFDGWGNAYSMQALASAGVGPVVVFDGVYFGFPVGPVRLDHVVAAGQTIAFAQPTAGTRLAFLGSSTNGPSSGIGSIQYSDGTSTPFTLTLSDWTLGGNNSPPEPGNAVAINMPYRIWRNGTHESVSTNVFFTAVPLDASRAVASVTLPAQATKGRMHVFAMTVAP